MISPAVRQHIIDRWRDSTPQREIAIELGLSKDQVWRVIHAYEKARQLLASPPPPRQFAPPMRPPLFSLGTPLTFDAARALARAVNKKPPMFDNDGLITGVTTGHPSRLEPILIVPDTHAPRHHRQAWALMLKAAKDIRPKHIVVIGDLADFTAVSSHPKSPTEVTQFEQEIEGVRQCLDDLDDLGAENKLYCEGNHEDRLHRYLQSKAAELYDLIDVEEVLELEQRGWKFIPYHQHAQVGKVYVTHDVGTSTRYSAYRALEAFEHSVVTGHSHRMAMVVEGNALGETKVSAQFGWLGDIEQMDYASRGKASKDWALGFGIGYLDPTTGYVYLSPVPIVRGTCVVNGNLYEAAAA